MALALVNLFVIIKSSNTEESKPEIPNSTTMEFIIKELGEILIMWKNTTFTNAVAYFETDVSDDFFTMNADGIVLNKQQLLADKERPMMLEILDFEFFEQTIKV